MLKRGQKQCPKCNTIVAARSSSCKSCEHVFYTRKTNVVAVQNKGIGKGKRKCPDCDAVVAARSINCPHCSVANGVVKVTKRATLTTGIGLDQLAVNDFVKVVGGSGPYYFDRSSNEKICMGHNGIFQIKEKKKNGLLVYGATRKNAGFCFLDLSGSRYNPDTGIYSEPYKLRKVVKRARSFSY